MNNQVEILLVEDNTSDAEITIRALRKHGLVNSLLHVKDGAEALDYLFAKGKYSNRKIEQGPKLVLLDLKMPKVTGIELLKKIKSDDQAKKIPVVVFTSSKETSDIQNCYNSGANSYVVKPLDFNEYDKVVSSLSHFWLHINEAPQ